MRKIPELDGVRGIAILAVLAVHASYGLIRGGYLGVDLFFVLSGFLITSLLAREKERTGGVSLRGFYTRRALRILPPLAACIALALVLQVANPEAALATGLFYANLLPRETMGALGHTWSLAIEEHFYLAWPLLFLAAHRRWTLAIAIGAAIALRLALGPTDFAYRFTLSRIDALAIGCFAALVPWRATSNSKTALICLAAVAACVLFVQQDAMMGVGFTFFAFLSATLIRCALASADQSLIRRILCFRPLQYLGTRSYGLYLYHLPIFYFLEPLRIVHNPQSAAQIAALKLILSFAVAEISYQTIENLARHARARNAPEYQSSQESCCPSPPPRA